MFKPNFILPEKPSFALPDKGRAQPEKHCFTIPEFCESHGNISRVKLYDLWKHGKGPRIMRIGRRVIITEEAAADWRKQMEAESNPRHAAVL